MDILAVSGSLRKNSFNTALLKAAKNLAPNSMRVSIYDSLAAIPPFDPDINEQNLPQIITDFRSRLAAVQGVIISTPEYAHGVPGVLKNALDWLVASSEFVLKPVLVTSVSTTELGGLRAHGSLIATLSAMNTRVIVTGSVNVPFAKSKFNADGELIDPLIRDSLMAALSIFEKAIEDDR